MRIELAYGRDGLTVDLPDDRTTVIEPLHPERAADERAEVLQALRHPVAGPPLREIVRGGRTVAISICDGTRPQPRQIVVPALLEELAGLMRLDDVVVLVATGTHRGNTPDELRAMLGDEVLAAVRVVNHDARDDASLTWMGRHGAAVPVWLNSEWAAADVRITTGFVEPHFFAGFSGGPKLVAPGLAGLETTLTLHDAARIGHPDARWGVTEGNPVHDDVRAIAAATGTHFALDVVLDGEQRIAHAFGGELFAMHEAACALVRQTAMRPVPRPFDVVLTTNSGFPLDQNLYQAVKGMSAAAQVVREGGTIVCAAECRDGFPAHGPYREELSAAASPAALLAAIGARTQTVADQWQIQIQAGIQARSRVIVHTSYLSDAELAEAHLEQTPDVEATVLRLLEDAGPRGRVCVLPYGPLTVPYLAG
ncbi:MAG: lactate racemase [Gaiellales bacterium]|nr:lactate racemase [Gaiellales bacterium]